MIETYSQIIKNLKKDKFSKIYLLMGEEAFFINKISQFFQKNFINEDHKGFNQEIHYGKETTIESIINSCKSFPMMSDKKLVIVKEAKELDVFKRKSDYKINLLINYLLNPNPTSTLVICLKNKSLDKRSKLYKNFLKNSDVLDTESKENKVYDNKLPLWIKNEVEGNNFKIKEEAIFLLSENIGNNLERINNALEKIFMNNKDKIITSDDVINLIGINREYNFFEFQDSLIDKNSVKCTKILNYFNSNEKKYPIQQIIVYLFTFYSKLLVVKTRDLSESDNISSVIGVHPYVAKSYLKAKSNYNLREIINIINHLRKLDLISKGIIQIKSSYRSLMYEMIFKIFINK